MHTLIVADVTILQDNHGRYNLNLLHQASGTAPTKRPTDWLRRKTTQALIRELGDQSENLPYDVVKGGNESGTYVHELLAISYAGWISPAFQLKVNQAFIDMKKGVTLPQVHDQRTKIAIETLLRLDEAEQRIAQLEEQKHAHELRLARNEERINETYTHQDFWTVAEYVVYHELERQCPKALYVEASRHMGGYCQRERKPFRDPSVLPRKIPVGAKSWETEWGFHTSIYEKAFIPWLLRQQSQIHLLPPRQEGA
jgi:hypothetical protein